MNAEALLELLQKLGPSSRPALSRASGLSLPTVNARVQTLLDAGFIREVGSAKSRGGRPARLLEFNARFGFVAGIDVGGGRVAVALSDLAGRILARKSVCLEGKSESKNVAGLAERLLQSMLQDEDPEGGFLALGLSTPGLVEPGMGRVTFVPNIIGWEEFGPVDAFGAAFGVPVVVENNVNAAMLGERWRGAAREAGNAIFVSIGRGVGAGVLIGGELYRGLGGAAGEIGLQRPFEDEEPLDGLFGPLERKTSESGMMLRYRSLGGEEGISVEEIAARAASGEELARRVISESASLLAGGLVNVCAVLAPELIILGGGTARMKEAFLKPVRERLTGALPRPPLVAVSELGDDASVAGALKLSLDDAHCRLFSFGRRSESPPQAPCREA